MLISADKRVEKSGWAHQTEKRQSERKNQLAAFDWWTLGGYTSEIQRTLLRPELSGIEVVFLTTVPLVCGVCGILSQNNKSFITFIRLPATSSTMSVTFGCQTIENPLVCSCETCPWKPLQSSRQHISSRTPVVF